MYHSAITNPTLDLIDMQSQTRRTLDGLLAIGPHRLDDQLRALTEYAERAEYALDVFWAILPGESPVTDGPDSAFPIVVFDDDIAAFTPDEYDAPTALDEPQGGPTTDWHVAHATPQPKLPTMHLPVYGCPADGETAADAILCVGSESLDLQLARMEAYAIRSAIRLRGVYIASNPSNLLVLLRDFSASNKAVGTGPSLTVGPLGTVELHQ